ncbi:MAG: SIS domain-containing protein [Ignavibacteriales bacterium]|nr:SIS domain-containing protein [Ignavibacteriales bacterium]
MDLTQEINEYLDKLKNTIDSLDRDEMNKFLEILLETYEKERAIYIFGNGGSASAASHFACDINKCTTWMDKKIKVVSLVDNVPSLMAHANDMGFENTFLEQLKEFFI